MSFKWSEIEPLLQEAHVTPVTIELESRRLAKLFRYSIYNYRRIKESHKELKIKIFQEEEKFFLSIYKPVEIYLKKLEPQENFEIPKSL